MILENLKDLRLVIEYISVDKLTPDPNNARKHEKADVKAVQNSIDKFGMCDPIGIWGDENMIVEGHGRLLALKQLGYTEAPCIRLDHLDEEGRKMYALAHNKTAELSSWDNDKVKATIKSLAEYSVSASDFGFDLSEFEERKEVEEVELEDAEEEAEESEPRVKAGEVWQLGRHRLMCGDSTDKADVLKLLDGARADMVFTDPPYGVNVEGGKNNNTIAGDLTQTAIPFSFEICTEVATKDAARFYFCGGEANISLYFKLFERYLRQMPRLLVWVKENQVLSHNNYHKQYELIFFGYKKGGGNVWYGSRKMEDASDVWNVSRDPSKTYVHPTQKPVELPARAIRNSSKEGDIVFEPFSGSGSTMLACEQLNRICYAMELDPKYCEATIQRWEQLTGKTAVKIEEDAEECEK